MTQGGAGGFTLTIDAGGGGTFAWDGGTTPSPDTTAGVTVRYIAETIDAGANWVGDLVGGGSVSPLTTKGDLWGYDSDDARVPVGTDGLPLVADSSAGVGVSYSAISVVAAYPFHAEPLCDSSGPILTATGDVIMVTGVPN